MDDEGNTCLHLGARNSISQIVEEKLLKKIDSKHLNQNGESYLDLKKVVLQQKDGNNKAREQAKAEVQFL